MSRAWVGEDKVSAAITASAAIFTSEIPVLGRVAGVLKNPLSVRIICITSLTMSRREYSMPKEKDQMIAVRLTSDLLKELDGWRESLTVPPTRSDALRYLIKLGLEHAKGKKR